MLNILYMLYLLKYSKDYLFSLLPLIYNAIKTENKYFIFFVAAIIIFLIKFHRKYKEPIKTFDKSIITASSFGVVNKITEDEQNYIITAFLSPIDIHIQYFPFDGKIIEQMHKHGRFVPAYVFKKTKYNERFQHTIQTEYGIIKIMQIAGILVRKIIPFYKINDQVKRQDELGLITFGSRVDMFIPKKNTQLLVKKNQKLYGPNTPVAKWTNIKD